MLQRDIFVSLKFFKAHERFTVLSLTHLKVPSSSTNVFVAMSGGVDSSVTAYLLHQQGMKVTGLFMKNWEEEGACTSRADSEDVLRICERLNIDSHVVNFSEEYWDSVFAEFLAGTRAGLTPNPDVLCNREIKFKALFDKARQLGADYLATGHYCRTAKVGGQTALLRGSDSQKDQSYFLYMVPGRVLDRVLFPLGELTKPQVRQLAHRFNLPVATKRESMGICFVGKRKLRPFLSRYVSLSPGSIRNLRGLPIGEHEGLGFYTMGQRKGLTLGGMEHPQFVANKDVARNHLIVASGHDHPALFHNALWAQDLHWVRGQPPAVPFSCEAKTRYRQEQTPCTISVIDQRGAKVRFLEAQRAVTPGQSIVFYRKDECLGGGIISHRWNL